MFYNIFLGFSTPVARDVPCALGCQGFTFFHFPLPNGGAVPGFVGDGCGCLALASRIVPLPERKLCVQFGCFKTILYFCEL